MTSERIPYSQSGRMMAVETKLGPDVLLLHHLEIDERVNALFEIQAAVKAQRDDLQAGDLIGSSVDFRVADNMRSTANTEHDSYSKGVTNRRNKEANEYLHDGGGN